MGRPGITYHDVANAAQQVTTADNNPTIESVRAILKTGSSSTIAQHLRDWKAKQSDTFALASKEKIPEELVAALKGLWQKLVTESEEQVEIIKQQHEDITKQHKGEIEKLQRNCSPPAL